MKILQQSNIWNKLNFNFKMMKKINTFDSYHLVNQNVKSSSFIKLKWAKFSNKDEAFWEEYMRRKSEGGRIPALESQEIIINKVIHSWKYAKNHSLTDEEFLQSLRELETHQSIPFIVLDVREEVELDLFKLPLKNKKGVELPVVYRSINELNHGNFEDLPMSKYIICIDSIGLRGRMAARNLNREGFLALYVEGGYDLFIPIANEKGI